jgi:RNA polymerase sigma-70 factor (ECF subfamily)
MAMSEVKLKQNQRIKYPNTAEQTLWLTMTKQGDPAAFSHLVKKYQGPVYNLCYYMLDDAPAAEDATQEVFIRVYFKLDTYDETRQFSTWLFSIAAHYCLDRLKMRRLRVVSWDFLPSWTIISSEVAAQPELLCIKKETRAEVRDLLNTLQTEQRTIIVLKYWHDMRCDEIAEIMDTSVGAVKSKLFRARKKMAAQVTKVAQKPDRDRLAICFP